MEADECPGMKVATLNQIKELCAKYPDLFEAFVSFLFQNKKLFEQSQQSQQNAAKRTYSPSYRAAEVRLFGTELSSSSDEEDLKKIDPAFRPALEKDGVKSVDDEIPLPNRKNDDEKSLSTFEAAPCLELPGEFYILISPVHKQSQGNDDDDDDNDNKKMTESQRLRD